MFWTTRQFGVADWFEIRERFRYQYALMDTPRDMLLIATKGAGQKTRLYVGVPSRRLLAPYEGFNDIDEMWIPRNAILMVGDSSRFRERFTGPRG